MDRPARIREPSVKDPRQREAADAAADADGGRGQGAGNGGVKENQTADKVARGAARADRVAERARLAHMFLLALGLVAVGLEAGPWAPVAMYMAGQGGALEALVDALRLCREAAAVPGGFCDMAGGKPGTWPSWRKNPSFFRWSWPGRGRGVLGANGHVTDMEGLPGQARPEDADLPMGARAYKVFPPLRKW